ncbi:transcription factor TFIIIB subunit brf1 [Rhodotorula mucilaginosa]|uniref:B-related factor 1 n=1 Tax=Rhodotorula mucilaginosa TaxID=5537 RepID=A0A9P6W0W3_RHOMI|nr:transcription factor TFIIIB subunit brf1 [Rhodotorula mucilaginosa]
MELATGLRLSEHLQNVATRFFNLAVNMNFTKGRRTQYVAAACLYAACRQANGTQMLIDFSDLLEINVFTLGSTYLKLVRELAINVPVVDPVIYITRFAALLDFGDETQKVALDATRLVNRMGRDWMQIGRRPSGICGACLLLAARMNNFRRSIEEIVQVVKIADVTLQKRLAEFKETASGSLTVSDFRTIWLDETADPPAYSQGIKKEEAVRHARERKLREDTGMSETDSAAGDHAFRELAEREATAEVEYGPDELPDPTPAGGGAPPAAPNGNGHEHDGDAAMPPPPVPSSKSLGKRKRSEADGNGDDDDGDAAAAADGDVATGAPSSDPAEEVLEGDEREQYEAVIEGELQQYLGSEVGSKLQAELDSQEQRRFQKLSQTPHGYEFDQNDSLEGLDEEELDAFILSPEEIEIKSKLWMQANKDYLKELAEKQTGPDGEVKPIAKRPRKRVKPRDGQNATGITAADATTKMLEKKKFSKKINYDAIKNLFNTGDSDAGSAYGGDDDDGDGGGGEEAPLIGQSYGRARKGGRRSRIGTPIATPEPTWRQGSRAPSETPSRLGRNAQVAASGAADEDEGEDDDDHVAAPQPDPEEHAWRSQFATATQEDDFDGYDEV